MSFDKVENAASQLIDPLEKFRKDQIGEAKVRIFFTVL